MKITKKETKSIIDTIEMLRRLAFNVHGVMDVVDCDNIDKAILIIKSVGKVEE